MIQKLFLRLLRAALWNEPVELDTAVSAETWYDVYGMARRQTVEGILYDVVSRLPSDSGIPRNLALKWMVSADNIEKWYRRMAVEVGRQTRQWQENGIDAVLMKGLGVAAMYPVPEHRISGDIDWWIRGENDWLRALELVQENGAKIRRDSDGDIHYVCNNIVVEHHRNGMPADGPVGVLLMLNGHILHHAMVTGIGIRHLCDMAMAYRYYNGSYDMGNYVAELKNMRMLRWTVLLHRVLCQSLGTPADILPEIRPVIRVPHRDIGRFLRLVMTDGNFGFGKKWRYGGFLYRFMLLMRYVPGKFVRRWTELVIGRVLR